MRKVALGAAVLVLAAAVVVLSRRAAGEAPALDQVVAQRRDIVRSATVRGRLEAAESLKFGPPPVQSQWQFKIAYLAPEGEEVEAGAPLVGFDTTELARRLLEARSALATASTQLDKEVSNARLLGEQRGLEVAEAQAAVDRLELKADVPPEVAASRELQKTRLELAEARAKSLHLVEKSGVERDGADQRIEHLRSQAAERAATVTQLEKEIASMMVRAPSAGTVVYVTNWRNEKKKVGDQTHRMERVLSLPDLSRLRAVAFVEEAYAALVQIGQPVRFALDALPEREFEGRIATVQPAVRQRSRRDRRKMVQVGIELVDPDIEKMRPGMRLQGDLEVARLAEVVAVPLRCVASDAAGASVRRRGLFGSRRTPVVLGDFDDGWVEVRSGLTPGDRLHCPEDGA